jgi:signal peptidase II
MTRWLFGLVAVAALVVDVVTKTLAVRYLDPLRPPVLFGGVLRLQLVRNGGAAFSLGQDFTPIFAVLSVLVLVFVVAVLAPRLGHRGWAVALGLLCGGVAGNLSDRLFRSPGILRGHVVDFLQLPHWAIFNFADSCVVSAAILIVILAIFRNVGISGRSYTRTAVPSETLPGESSHVDQRRQSPDGSKRPGETSAGGQPANSPPQRSDGSRTPVGSRRDTRRRR